MLLTIIFWPWRFALDLPMAIRCLGVFCLLGGVGSTLAAARTLNRSFRSSLKPMADAPLVQGGLYGFVRHPGYSGIIIAAAGWSLVLGDLARLVLTIVLVLFFDAKSRVEEEWLVRTYQEYGRYRKSVPKKFFPWVY
ncbi:MAG: methyltransferase [Elusimicrobia bacterium]|nr:methyltransferase [Elusimicrobiota bacterium]